MRVRVEEPVPKDLLEICSKQPLGDLRPVDARFGDGVVIGSAR